MSRTIKQKSNKEYTPFLCFSKNHIALERNNKRREFLNCFCDNAIDELISYEEKFVIERRYIHHPRYKFLSGLQDFCVLKVVPVTIEEEIQENYESSLADENDILDVSYDFDNLLYKYAEERKISQELKYFFEHDYISDETFGYYFGKNLTKKEVPDWAIVARLANITPSVIARCAGISKKMAREIYSQFDLNWSNIHPNVLHSKYTAYKLELPFALSELCRLYPSKENNLKYLWIHKKQQFEKCEIIREAGQEYMMPSNAQRIENAICNLRNGLCYPKLPEFNSAEEMVIFFEGLLCEDREFSDCNEVFHELPFIKSITSNPRKIYYLGNKYGNCLKQKAVRWEVSNGFVLETKDGVVFQIKRNKVTGRFSVADAKRKFNTWLTESDEKMLTIFLEINNLGVKEDEDEDPGF